MNCFKGVSRLLCILDHVTEATSAFIWFVILICNQFYSETDIREDIACEQPDQSCATTTSSVQSRRTSQLEKYSSKPKTSQLEFTVPDPEVGLSTDSSRHRETFGIHRTTR
ncbi:hypothetical protein AMATHDRAFT_46644 [Amanita thiersii Skay4041]|uniref:Uncharacterized protein n=1 Tax=Amanita thiersii Skay4041 TaxID=703135 RepID=A0A2A9NRV2_9AGAR|nr:hypothetical protein AMATHDRAFT_46644 [Amanita thiersii Skay4041]